jgi:hypothetical protein
MSTSDFDTAATNLQRPFDEAATGSSSTATLPDITALTQMAKAFRALPNQDSVRSAFPSAGVPEGTQPVILPSEAYQPQFGIPAPSLPAVPSMDKFPVEADFARFAGSSVPAAYSPEVSAFSPSASLTPSMAILPTTARLASFSVFIALAGFHCHLSELRDRSTEHSRIARSCDR